LPPAHKREDQQPHRHGRRRSSRRGYRDDLCPQRQRLSTDGLQAESKSIG
jgi:hypothetical protein